MEEGYKEQKNINIVDFYPPEAAKQELPYL